MIASRRERWLVAAAAIVVGGLLLDSLWLSPLFVRRAALERREIDAQAKLTKAQKAVARGPRLERQLATVERELQGLAAESAAVKFDETLTGYAKEAGAGARSVVPDETTKMDPYQQVGYRLDVYTSIDALQEYLWLLDTSVLPLKISSLTIAGQDRSDELHVTMRVSTLTLPKGRAAGGERP